MKLLSIVFLTLAISIVRTELLIEKVQDGVAPVMNANFNYTLYNVNDNVSDFMAYLLHLKVIDEESFKLNNVYPECMLWKLKRTSSFFRACNFQNAEFAFNGNELFEINKDAVLALFEPDMPLGEGEVRNEEAISEEVGAATDLQLLEQALTRFFILNIKLAYRDFIVYEIYSLLPPELKEFIDGLPASTEGGAAAGIVEEGAAGENEGSIAGETTENTAATESSVATEGGEASTTTESSVATEGRRRLNSIRRMLQELMENMGGENMNVTESSAAPIVNITEDNKNETLGNLTNTETGAMNWTGGMNISEEDLNKTETEIIEPTPIGSLSQPIRSALMSVFDVLYEKSQQRSQVTLENLSDEAWFKQVLKYERNAVIDLMIQSAKFLQDKYGDKFPDLWDKFSNRLLPDIMNDNFAEMLRFYYLLNTKIDYIVEVCGDSARPLSLKLLGFETETKPINLTNKIVERIVRSWLVNETDGVEFFTSFEALEFILDIQKKDGNANFPEGLDIITYLNQLGQTTDHYALYMPLDFYYQQKGLDFTFIPATVEISTTNITAPMNETLPVEGESAAEGTGEAITAEEGAAADNMGNMEGGN